MATTTTSSSSSISTSETETEKEQLDNNTFFTKHVLSTLLQGRPKAEIGNQTISPFTIDLLLRVLRACDANNNNNNKQQSKSTNDSNSVSDVSDVSDCLECACVIWKQSAFVHPDHNAIASDIVKQTGVAIASGPGFDINQWAAEKTHGMITNLIENQRNVLNFIGAATFFDGKFTIPFKASNTADMDFTCADGRVVSVKMMNDRATDRYFGYSRIRDGSSVVIMPYTNGAQGLFFLPAKNESVLAFLARDGLDLKKYNVFETNVNVSIPKFAVSSRGMLSSVMKAAQEMDLLARIEIDQQVLEAYHATRVETNETGTTAASVCYTIARSCSGCQWKGNRPFVHLVVHQNQILYLTIINDALDAQH
jgi:serine protease inhibitor